MYSDILIWWMSQTIIRFYYVIVMVVTITITNTNDYIISVRQTPH
jgi:hypothetical protein